MNEAMSMHEAVSMRLVYASLNQNKMPNLLYYRGQL